MKIFKRLLNVAVHDAFMVYNSRNKTHHLTYRLDVVKALILTQAKSHQTCWARQTIKKPSTRQTFRKVCY
jgi:hypothetical protein